MDHKSNFSKIKKIEILSSIFSDHNAIRLDINYKKKTVRNTNTWRFKNVFLNNQQVTEEIKREIDTYTHTQRSTQNGFKDLNIRPETISMVKRQSSEWEKIIANETTDKGLISKIYKQLI